MAKFYLGVDGGGTKCRAGVFDEHGHMLGEGYAGSAHTRYDAAQVVMAIMSACDKACLVADISQDAIAIVCIGLAGTERPDKMQLLRNHNWPFAKTLFASDAKTACIGAHGGGDGAIVIVGTGSVAMGQVGGAWVKIGGYGYPADNASGSYLGVAALQHALLAHDRGDKSPLVDELYSALGATQPNIVAWIDRADPTQYATLAPIVVRAANSGDEMARTIMQDMADNCAKICFGLIDKGVQKICLMGGLAPHIHPFMDSKLAGHLVKPKGDALMGAFLLAKNGLLRDN